MQKQVDIVFPIKVNFSISLRSMNLNRKQFYKNVLAWLGPFNKSDNPIKTMQGKHSNEIQV